MFDINAAVTDRIIDQLEKGIVPWHRPWVCGEGAEAVSRTNGRAYSVLNQMLLGEAGEFATFKQITDAGGKVKKGAKARMVVFWKMLFVEEKNSDGSTVIGADGKVVMKTVPILKYYNVFKIGDDTEGIDPKYFKPIDTVKVTNHAQMVEKAEAVLRDYLVRSGVGFQNKAQGRAYYSPMADSITVPMMEQFPDTAEYYSTVFHEVTHSTGHKSRFDRFRNGYFGDTEYSKEELVAEIGAAGILHSLGMETDGTFNNSAAYIDSWLHALRNDKKMIVAAAGKAQKAVEMIMNAEAAGETLAA